MDKQLYAVPEAAAILGISVSHLWAILARGGIESVTVGRARRIPADAIAKFVAERRAEAVGVVAS